MPTFLYFFAAFPLFKLEQVVAEFLCTGQTR